MHPLLERMEDTKVVVFVVVYLSFLLDNVLLTVVGKVFVLKPSKILAHYNTSSFSTHHPRLPLLQRHKLLHPRPAGSNLSKPPSAEIRSPGEGQRPHGCIARFQSLRPTRRHTFRGLHSGSFWMQRSFVFRNV